MNNYSFIKKIFLIGVLSLNMIFGFSQAFNSVSIFPLNTPNFISKVIDYDNDGDDDIIGYQSQLINSTKIYRNNGNSTFTDVSTSLNFPVYNYLKMADFDKNGFMDVYNISGDTLRISFNNGISFSTPSLSCGYFLLSNLFNTLSSNIKVAQIGDYNNDGVFDLLINQINGSNSIIKAKSGVLSCSSCFYTFNSANAIQLVSFNTVNSIGINLADIDNDNDFDLLLAEGSSQYSNYNYYIFLNSNGLYTQATGTNYNIGRINGFGVLGEFNNDGKIDIVSGAADCCISGNPLRVFFSNSNISYTLSTIAMQRSGNPYYNGASIFDINLDNKQDVIWTDMTGIGSSALQCFINNGNNTFTESASSLGINYGPTSGTCCPLQNAQYSAIIDINNDKKPDIDIHEIDWTAPYSVTNTYQRINSATNNAVKLKLEACAGLREGWGARIKYKSGGTWSYQQHTAYSSSNYPFLYLGMGSSTIIDSMIIYWIGGNTSTYTNVNSGTFLIAKETLNCISSSNFGSSLISQDTIKACGDSVLVSATSGMNTYSWLNGKTTASFFAKSTGWYKVTATNSSGCSGMDSVFVSIVKANIINNDTSICLGRSVRLNADSILGSSSLSSCAPLPANLQNGLVGYWPFCGNANDMSGNGNNGTVNGATLTSDRFGNANSAYSFSNNYILIPSSTVFNSNNLTVSMWISSSSLQRQIALIRLNYINANNEHFGIALNDLNNYGVELAAKYNNISCSPGIGWQINEKIQNILNSQYHLVVGTINGNELKLYIDGNLSNILVTPFSQTSNCWGGDIQIGRNWASFVDYFNGKLDDIAIWNRALTPQEIQQLYSSSYPQSYFWSTGDTTPTINVTPTVTTKYWVRVSNGSDFCTDTVTVMVSQSSTSIINQSICLGQSFLGRTISGTYIDTLNGANSRGCDSIRTLNLTVNLETFSTINQTICQGKSFLGRTISGTYIDTLKNSNSKGCDSIRTLNLTVNPSTFSTINQTICQGDSFLGKKSTGIYVDTLNGANSRGCDSIRTLNLFVNSSIAPTALDSQIFCMSAQIKDLIITGNLIKWYQDSLKKIILNDNAQLSDNVTYYATQSINNCESAIKKVKAYINLGNITSDKPSYCEGDTISLTFQSLFNKLLWFNGATTKTIKIIAQQSMSYTVDYSYRNKSCSTSINIVSYPIPPKPKATSPQTYSNDNTLDDLIVTGNSLNWYEDSFLQKNIPSSTSLQNEKVYYVTQRANNCESEATAIKATLELKVLFDSIYVNNSMSPNNDQIMDAFTIENIHLAKNNKIQIANRWGEIVFEKENYQNDWYGEYLTNGYKNNTLPDGVYYYVFSFTIYGQKNEKTGYIYIKK
jgi:gliding motility-associated-like protein